MDSLQTRDASGNVDRQGLRRSVRVQKPDPVAKPFFWLTAFYVVYCARPEDWIPGLGYLPLAKITAICALIGLLMGASKMRRTVRDMPIEAKYLAAILGWYFISAFLSPVWRGGALSHTIDYSKVWVVYALTFLLITDFAKLKRVIFIQAGSVPLICAISVIKGHSMPRLQGVLGGIYGNPNDLAFAIVLTLPFCAAFMLTAKNIFRRAFWLVGMLIMGLALVMTASRAGFVSLLISGSVSLWHFGVRGRRFVLIIATVFAGILLLVVAGGPLITRMSALTGEADSRQEQQAFESYEQRRYLMIKAIEGIEQYPIFGIGAFNFEQYSEVWHEVHMSYLQVAVEGGIPCGILYLLFFYRGFKNLKKLRKLRNLDVHTTLFVGGLHASLVGFVVGALFAPEAYQFFPYFAVAYTSALVATVEEQGTATESPANSPWRRNSLREVYASHRKSEALTFVR